jgi:hypothetical protein
VQAGLFAQTGRLGRIAILPFSGGTADEREGIAELFSFTPGMMGNFMVMPRTGITRAVANEQEFQAMSGMTSADTIARLGNQFGAEYVMAGSITSVENRHLLIVSIVRIDVIRQVAGDFLEYDSLDALNRDDSILERMAENLVGMLRTQTDDLEKLALLPVDFPDGSANVQEGDALAQLLAIYLLRHNTYAVYPRTRTLEQVQEEYENQLGGATRESEAVVAGQGDNPPYALSVVSRRIASMSRFNASIIDLEGGNQVAGRSEQYATLRDGMNAIEFLARELSGQEVSDLERSRRDASVTSTVSAAEAQARREAAARRRAEARDRFNENAAFVFGFEYGFSIISKNLIDEKIFPNEYLAKYDNVPSKSKYDGDGNRTGSIPGDPKIAPTRIGFLPGVLVGFQYSWFSINAGASFGYGYDGPSQIVYNFVQVPVLLRGDWVMSYSSSDTQISLTLDAFAGMGLNFPLKATAQLSQSDWGDKDEFDTTLTMSPTIIIGAGIGMGTARATLYTDFRGAFDIAATGAKLSDGRAGSFKRATFDMAIGLKFRVPFYSGGSTSSGAFW